VLAGGRSTRFGRDKLLEPYRGAPMLHHTVRSVAEVCDDVVIVLAPSGGEPALPDGVRARFVRDAVAGEGPLRGLATGLGVVEAPMALVVAGDMPDLEPAVLTELLRVVGAGSPAAALEEGTRARPLPCVLRVRPATEAAERLLGAGRRRLRDLLDELGTTLVPERTWRALDPEGRSLRDVDEPGDLDR
jgi:molybdopterin-guanine dinucleotide biosynthesis protein A